MNILEKVAITERNSLSDNLLVIGVIIGFIGVIYLGFSSYNNLITQKEYKKFFKAGLVLFFVSVFVMAFSSLPFPFLLQETGKYKYICTFDEDVSANYISENYEIIGVKDGKWILEDK